MRIKIKLIYLVLASAGLLPVKNAVLAQTGVLENKIYGIIADTATQKPLQFVTVNLTADSNRIEKVILSKTNGSFMFSGIRPLKYAVVIVAVGYAAKAIAVDFSDSSKRSVDLGLIYLLPKVAGLKEVVVSARRPIIKQEVDRISYDMQADPESKANSLLEMMRKVPYLSLDGNGNILMKGNGSFKILVNGKPSGIMERNPAEVLRSIPASTIQRIEVITTPPAKYDAEGLAGIINIITVKKTGNGYTGSVNLNERFPTGGPGAGTSFSIKQGNLGIAGYGGASLHNMPETRNSISRTTYETSTTDLEQNGLWHSDSRNNYFGTDISYEIDSLNLVSSQFNVYGNKSLGVTEQNTLFSDASGLLQKYDLENNNKNSGHGLDVALNYQLGYKRNKNRFFTFSYRYFQFLNDQNADISLFNKFHFDEPDYHQTSIASMTERTFQADYVSQVKNLSIEAGIKGILRDNKSDFEHLYFNDLTNVFEKDTSLTNAFTSTQSVFAAYNTYQYNSEKWDIKGGFRIEQTVIDADFTSTVTSVRQNYFHVIPSLSVNRKFKNHSTLNLGFSPRIKRPGINRLNPFVDRSNPKFVSSGNPNLKPVVIYNMQVSYGLSKKLSVNVGVEYGLAKNVDNQVYIFDPFTSITHITYENTGKGSRLAFNYNVGYPITKNWNITANGNIAYFWNEGLINGKPVENNILTHYTSLSTSCRFDKGWQLNVNLNVISRSPVTLQAVSNALVSSAFSVNKDIIKDKFSFSVAANNPFKKYRNNRTEIFGPWFTEVNSTREYFRGYNLSLNYRFGKLSANIKKNRRSIRNDDIAN